MHRTLIIIGTLLIATLLFLGACAPTPAPAPAPTPAPAPAPAPTPVPAPTPETATYTGQWAQAQVSAYLYNLAKSPDAMRHLADLGGYFETRFSENEVDLDYGGHKYSGWQVYLRKPSRYPDNLNWAVFKDGYVTEGSNDALRVKADLIELSQSQH